MTVANSKRTTIPHLEAPNLVTPNQTPTPIQDQMKENKIPLTTIKTKSKTRNPLGKSKILPTNLKTAKTNPTLSHNEGTMASSPHSKTSTPSSLPVKTKKKMRI